MQPGGQVRGVYTPSEMRGSQRSLSWGWMAGACTSPSSSDLPLAPPEPLGADAFLPALTEELIWSPDIGETQLDVEFLMELLDPEELLGEGKPPFPDIRTQQGEHPKQPHSAAGGKAGKLGHRETRESCTDPFFLPLVGYYLTTWFGALHHIAHYQPEAGRAPQGLSSEASASLCQWHRRRTLQGQGHSRAQVTAGLHGGWRGGLAQLPF